MRIFLLPIFGMLAYNADNSTPKDDVCDVPVAEAGTDIIINMGESVTLNASESTWCDDYTDTTTGSMELCSYTCEFCDHD